MDSGATVMSPGPHLAHLKMRLREGHHTLLPIKFAGGKLEGSSQVHLAPKAEFFARFLAASLGFEWCS